MWSNHCFSPSEGGYQDIKRQTTNNSEATRDGAPLTHVSLPSVFTSPPAPASIPWAYLQPTACQTGINLRRQRAYRHNPVTPRGRRPLKKAFFIPPPPSLNPWGVQRTYRRQSPRYTLKPSARLTAERQGCMYHSSDPDHIKTRDCCGGGAASGQRWWAEIASGSSKCVVRADYVWTDVRRGLPVQKGKTLGG